MSTCIVRGENNYVHFPRSGGNWMAYALVRCAVPTEFTLSADPHQPVMDSLLPAYMTVRPVGEWWDSWYKFHQRTDWLYFAGGPQDSMANFEKAARQNKVSWEDFMFRLLQPGVTVLDMKDLYSLFETLSGKPLPNKIRTKGVNVNG